MENGTKYVSWKVFMWIIGTMITMLLVSYGYMYSQTQDTIIRVHNNEVMIGRLEERLDGILAAVIEIKDIIKDK